MLFISVGNRAWGGKGKFSGMGALLQLSDTLIALARLLPKYKFIAGFLRDPRQYFS